MTTCPKLKELNAWINLQPPGPSRLIVTCEVETNAGNQLPVLSRAEPQGIVEQQLILDLSIVDHGGVGTQDVAFRPARYEQLANSGQYSSVAIRWNAEIVEVVQVNEVH